MVPLILLLTVFALTEEDEQWRLVLWFCVVALTLVELARL